jgi:hypothetical protein
MSDRGLDTRLLESSPILESFGNAKTGKNNNSSRFGKFMKLLYHHPNSAGSSIPIPASSLQTNLVGATVETYLLEKSRVVHQARGERNYHIFYRLLQGIHHNRELLTDKFLSIVDAVGLINPDNFQLLNQSGCSTIDEIREQELFPSILEALHVVGFTMEDIEQILLLLYGILLLGNITFYGVDTDQGVSSLIKDDGITSPISHIANIFGVDISRIQGLLTERKVYTRGEWFAKHLTVVDAIYTRDAVTKSLYESLFQFIVDGINRNLAVEDTTSRRGLVPNAISDESVFIGVLDIFGFENYAINQFEQLLINFANETIQHTFNKQVFDSELRLYQEENLDFTVTSIPDNTGCVDLIADRNSSILFVLDAVSRQPKACDDRFCEELHKSFGGNKHVYFLSVHPRDRRNTFVIRHYAGSVRYTTLISQLSSNSQDAVIDANSWISKNTDSYPDELVNVCQDAELKIMHQFNLFSAQDTFLNSAMNSFDGSTRQASSSISSSISGTSSPLSRQLSPNSVRRKTNIINKPTISALFTKSMRDLNYVLQSTSCQFVRCIKPNRSGIPGQFDNRSVVEQLRSLGVLQTCEVLKAGFPTRVSYNDLKESFYDVIKPVHHLFTKYDEQVLISCLLRAYEIDDDIYKLGRSMVFFKADQLAFLSQLLRKSHHANETEKLGSKILDCLQEVDLAVEETSYLDNEVNSLTTLITTIRNDAQSLILYYAQLEARSETVPVFSVPEDLTDMVSTLDLKHGQIKKDIFLAETSLRRLDSRNQELKDSSSNYQQYEHYKQQLLEQQKSLTEMLSVGKIDDDMKILKYLFQESRRNELSITGFLDELEEIEESLSAADKRYQAAKELAHQALDGVQRCKLRYTQIKIREYRECSAGLDLILKDVKHKISHAAAKYSTSHEDNAEYLEIRSLSQSLDERMKLLSEQVCAAKVEIENLAQTMAPIMKTMSLPANENLQQGNSDDQEIMQQDLTAIKEEISRLRAMAIEKGLSIDYISVAINSSLSATIKKEYDAPTTKLSSGMAKRLLATATRRNSTTSVDNATKPKETVVPEEANRSKDLQPLPNGWKEMFDKASKRPYYVNLETNIRQWQRPSTVVATVELPSTVKSASEDIRPVDRVSKRLKPTDINSILADRSSVKISKNPINNRMSANYASTKKSLASMISRHERVEYLRNNIHEIKYEPTVTGQFTITRLEEHGTIKKTGYLSKQSKVLGRYGSLDTSPSH